MIVIIPCWRRPAHLAALLRTIERARLAEDQRYIFTVDFAPAPQIAAVIDSFALRHRTSVVVYQGCHGYHGPAYNILCGWELGVLAAAAANPRDPIALLEEDLLVAEDLFEFWQDALDTFPMAVGVSACRNQNRVHGLPQVADPRDVYFDISYQSLAVALRRGVVEEVLQHATSTYYGDPAGYVARALPDGGLPSTACSQDGLFHRVIRRYALAMLYPTVPRACHVGWYGYNRPNGTPLHNDNESWRDDAERILAMSADQMNELADPRFRDIDRCDLIRLRAKLNLV